ncbi:GNAT family N-acetyltransferase [Listeria fleischmannii]|uniref:GNAT family N-acetyltransferase n=1 Tax=Listeria fleischmannii TaxID=1069827 RepID=UPI001627BA28|nr:GNAT family N-acetyltransferase [Listeria fleischmannii]MBC1418574.1 GNAT family N-acetyltransferase [Listeria fleischmannii]
MLTIREAEMKDAEDVIRYLNKVGGETAFLTFGENEFLVSRSDEEVIIQQFLNHEKACMYLAFEGDELVSVGQVIVPAKERMAHRGNIAISVKKDFWGQGIGSKMLEKLILSAKKSDLHMLTLEVVSENQAAFHLYKKMGFVVAGEYPDYFRVHNKLFTVTFMYRILKN